MNYISDLDPEFFAPWAVDATNTDQAMTAAARVLVLFRAGAYDSDDETDSTRHDTETYLDDLTRAIADVLGYSPGFIRTKVAIRANRFNAGFTDTMLY